MKLFDIKSVNEELQPVDLETIFNVRQLLTQLSITNAVIRSTAEPGTNPIVDVNGSVVMDGSEYSKLPIQFGKVEGDFEILNFTELTSLEGFPEEIGKGLDITRCNKLKSLKGITQKVGKSFYILGLSGIESLEGLPETMNGHLYVNICSNLKSLNGIPKVINGNVFISQNPKLRGHLQLFKVKGIKSIDLGNDKVSDIFQKYYHNRRDVIGCQDELIEAGLEQWARTK